MQRLMRTTIIGGSNTVMEPGYLGQMLAMMGQQGAPLDIVANLAVGGTTSAYGLYCLKKCNTIESSDLLLIEYALNDAFIYGDERRQFRHWARMYEGIIRHALSRNPGIRICTIILGSRNGSWTNSIPSIDAGIHYLSNYYELDLIDIPRLLLRRYGPTVVADPALYVDQGHYSRPVVTGMVADLAAEALAGIVSAHGQRDRTMVVPPAVDPEHFGDAEVIDAHEIFAAAGDAGLLAYHNRRFSLDAVDLAQHELTLALAGGKLLGVFHVSELTTATMSLYRNDSGYSCSLLKAGVRDGKFKFLSAMLPCEFLYGAELLQSVDLETIRIGRARPDVKLINHVAKDNVVQNNRDVESQRLPILGLMHSGKRQDLKVARREENASLAAE